MDFYGTDLPTLLHLRDELLNPLSESLKEALDQIDPDERNLTNRAAVREAAEIASMLTDLWGDIVPTAETCVEAVTDHFERVVGEITVEDAAAIQAYLLVIFGHDPLMRDDDDLS